MMKLKVYWMSHLPSWTSLAVTSFCHVLWPSLSFKGCAHLPTSPYCPGAQGRADNPAPVYGAGSIAGAGGKRQLHHHQAATVPSRGAGELGPRTPAASPVLWGSPESGVSSPGHTAVDTVTTLYIHNLGQVYNLHFPLSEPLFVHIEVGTYLPHRVDVVRKCEHYLWH